MFGNFGITKPYGGAAVLIQFTLFSFINSSNNSDCRSRWVLKFNKTIYYFYVMKHVKDLQIFVVRVKLYLFHNNNTWLQIGHGVILLGGKLVRNIFGQGKPLAFLPWIKTLSYSCRQWDSNPWPPSHSMVVLPSRLAHRLNHSATEDWYKMVAVK